MAHHLRPRTTELEGAHGRGQRVFPCPGLEDTAAGSGEGPKPHGKAELGLILVKGDKEPIILITTKAIKVT